MSASGGAMLTVVNDELSIAGLKMALQRIGLTHWSADGVLRSWAVAPVMIEGDVVSAPCADDEAVWIGFWMDDGEGSAVVSVSDQAAGQSGRAGWPEAYQLTALAGGPPRPIHREPGQAARELEVRVTIKAGPGEAAEARFLLRLLEPAAWARAAGRPEPPALKGPPPLPPRLG